MRRLLTKRVIFVVLVLLAVVFLATLAETRPRLAPGQAPLADLGNIEALRAQFNHDLGQPRLIILASPT